MDLHRLKDLGSNDNHIQHHSTSLDTADLDLASPLLKHGHIGHLLAGAVYIRPIPQIPSWSS